MNALDAEWLEADGLGGFASGTVSGRRTRRYHALLLAATTPPGGRMVLVNGVEVFVTTPRGRFALSSQLYAGGAGGEGVVHPDGAQHLESFVHEPAPTWIFRLPDGTRVQQQVLALHGTAAAALSWRLLAPAAEQLPGGVATGAAAADSVELEVRPLLSGRDPHALHHENGAFRFDATCDAEEVCWRPYDGVPAIFALSNGRYEHAPDWYRRFLYAEERARGLDDTEDLASPGRFRFALSEGEAWLVFAAGFPGGEQHVHAVAARLPFAALRDAELARRAAFATPLHRAADAYLARRGAGRTVLAGFPWFLDWGRDTFLALRGLCFATGRLAEAEAILVEWAGAVSEGMLPNRFPDRGETPEYNSVDASLWYVIAVHEFRAAAQVAGHALPPDVDAALRDAVAAILDGYARGTRHGIRADADGLLAAGAPGQQLTWMDAKVGDWVVTQRSGKPVEVQALWLNALALQARARGADSRRWQALFERGQKSFARRFWNASRGCLFDVIDVDHESGRVDASLRPNQILAVGGLPVPLLTGARAAAVVDTVERELLTPLGLRSLARGEPGYCPRYEGGVRERDGAYHQGTVWPWLLGPFAEAWLAVRGDTPDNRRTARERFVAPLLAHLQEAGLGHVSEIADAEAPHVPRGCPFQAWSLSELLRLQLVVLAEGGARAPRAKHARAASRSAG